jgi:hypothetical protein
MGIFLVTSGQYDEYGIRHLVRADSQDAVWKAVRDVVEPAESKPVPTGPRVTLEGIMAKVKGEEFFRVGPTLTVCALTLENGAHLVGESACVAPENFDEALGRKIARDNAIAKIWPLEGYLLRERLYRDAGRNRSIARLCYEIHRADQAKLGISIDPFEKTTGEYQAAFTQMVDSLRADPDALPEVVLADGSKAVLRPSEHIFRAVVGALA